jgi:hypothetical protein
VDAICGVLAETEKNPQKVPEKYDQISPSNLSFVEKE